MALFRRPRVDPEEMARIRDQVRFMREHFDAMASRRVEDGSRIDRLEAATANGEDADSVKELATRLDAVASDVAELAAWRASHEELRGQLSTLDERITAVSTELANQITELGNDLEGLGERTPEGGRPTRVVVDELRTGQERLANEQARYQIAFREDLARLAEQLRRAAPR